MPLSRLTAVLLRLYVLYQVLDFFVSLNLELWTFVVGPTIPGYSFFSGSLLAVAIDVLALVVLIILWSVANPLSRWMVGSPDPQVSLGTLSWNDLLHVSIIVIGLLFLIHGLASIGIEMQRLAFFHSHDSTHDNPALYANLLGAVIRFALGLFLVLGHRKALRWFNRDNPA